MALGDELWVTDLALGSSLATSLGPRTQGHMAASETKPDPGLPVQGPWRPQCPPPCMQPTLSLPAWSTQELTLSWSFGLGGTKASKFLSGNFHEGSNQPRDLSLLSVPS